jgi:hypothetical protein
MRNPFRREPKTTYRHADPPDPLSYRSAAEYRTEWERLYGALSTGTIAREVETESITKTIRVLRLSDGSFVPVIPGQRYIVACDGVMFNAVAKWNQRFNVIEFAAEGTAPTVGRADIDAIEPILR